MKSKVFVSGMMRSGTTLLQKALNAHPDMSVYYQSRTADFLNLKQKFLDDIGCQEYHLLKHYNPSETYKYNHFREWFSDEGNKGLLHLDDIFADCNDRGALAVGVKEVLMEEFYPILIKKDVKCLNIIRDPRDVITSMSFGEGKEHTGVQRPVLFDLRNWRKSVHFSHYLKHDPNFKSILFEDLLLNPEKILNNVFEWLGLEKFSLDGIEKNIESVGWSSNSSFGTKKLFDESAIGGHLKNLPVDVLAYIEAICWAEMKQVGYRMNINKSDVIEAISGFSDPFPILRDEFQPNYSCCPDNIKYELSKFSKEYNQIIKETVGD